MIDPDNNRPLDLLDECQSKYGLDRLRVVTENVSCYYRLCEFDRNADEWRASWKMGGISEHIDKAMTQAFSQIVKTIGDEAKQGATVLAPMCDAVAIVVPGQGKWVIKTPDGREWGDMTEEEQAFARKSDNANGIDIPEGYDPTTPVPTRVVSVITLEGTAKEITIMPPGLDPMVERLEEWIKDGEDTVPQSNGDIDEALLSFFTFIQLIGQTVHDGNPMSFEGLLKTAAGMPEEEGGRQLTAMLLRMASIGIAHGIFDLPSSDDDD